jgi:hypothetical protein
MSKKLLYGLALTLKWFGFVLKWTILIGGYGFFAGLIICNPDVWPLLGGIIVGALVAFFLVWPLSALVWWVRDTIEEHENSQQKPKV